MKRAAVIIGVLILIGLTAAATWWYADSRSEPAKMADQPTSTQTAPTEPAATTKPLVIYYVAEGDNGTSGTKIGCGDSLVGVETGPVTTDNPMKTALETLFRNKSQTVGQSGLMNALYQSDLRVDSAAITNGRAVVALSGSFKLGGECDNPRVKAQLEETAKTAAGVDEISITLNGQPLKDALSLQ